MPIGFVDYRNYDPSMPKTPPERTCIATGETKPQAEMLRFAIAPDGTVTFDLKGTLPGRGIWLTPTHTHLQQAIAKRRFQHSAKQKVIIPDNLCDIVSQQLRNHALGYLGRARQSGYLVSGYEKVTSALRSGEAKLLLHAEDAAEDGTRKLNPLAEGIKILHFGSRDELSDITHIPNPVHMVITEHGLNKAFFASYARWAGFVGKDTL